MASGVQLRIPAIIGAVCNDWAMRYQPLPADKFSFDHVYLRMSMPAGERILTATPSPQIDLLVGDPDRVFPLASVTKPIAAYAALVAVERGLIGLDDPAGPPGSTVRQLLSHTSGLPFAKGDPIARPARRRIYSNYGFDVLGDYLSERVGMPIQRWVREAVADPLGMDTFDLVAGQWPGLKADAVPGGSIAAEGVASADSIARFLMELMVPKLISPALFAAAVKVQFDGLAGVLPGYGKQQNNQWGLGFEIRGHKDPHWLSSDFSPETIGHFGQAGSFIWMDTEVRRPDGSIWCEAGLFLGERRYGRAHLELWPELTAQMRAL